MKLEKKKNFAIHHAQFDSLKLKKKQRARFSREEKIAKF